MLVRRLALSLSLAVACSRGETHAPAGHEAEATAVAVDPRSAPALAAFAERVGGAPRVLGSFAHTGDQPSALGLYATLMAANPGLFGLAKSPAACGLALDGIRGARVALAEPAGLLAEVDGPITLAEVACVFGREIDRGTITLAGVAVRERPGGIEARLASPAGASSGPGQALIDRFVARCAGVANCLVARLGPSDHPIGLESRLVGHGLEIRLELGDPARAASLAARLTAVLTDKLAPAILIHVTDGAVVATVPAEVRAQLAHLGLAELLAIRSMIGTLRSESDAMRPALEPGERAVLVKGDLAGALGPGDLVALESPARPGSVLVKRIIATAGQRVTVDEHGVAVDGVTLAREPATLAEAIPPGVAGDDPVAWREHLGDRSYLIFDGARGSRGEWQVPAGQVFVLGDNRQNAVDSRVFGGVPLANLHGRVAFRSGAGTWPRLAWDRLGVPIE